MDSITQAALGAAIGQSILGEKIQHRGAILGAVIATIPDLDVLLHIIYDSYDMLSIHRGFSHSIMFSFFGAFIIAYLLSKWKLTKLLSFSRLFIFTWLCLFTHMLLDAFTAYGTQLYLPFNNIRVGLDSINVVDPVYTLPLIIGLTLCLWKKKQGFNSFGLLLSTIYLVFTLLNKQRVEEKIFSIFLANNIKYTNLLTMPVGIANLNWYGVAKTSDSIYLRKYNIYGEYDTKIFSFPINDKYMNEIDQNIAEKMRWFAKGFYTVEKSHGKIRIYNLQVDMRGVVKTDSIYAPTVGYFEILNKDKDFEFSSGSIQLD